VEIEYKGLHVGCSQWIIPGYLNIDIRGPWDEGPTEIIDIREGLPYNNESFEIVYSSHVLEHFYWYELKGIILPEMMRVLKTGGILRLAVPDVEKTIQQFREHTYLLPGVLYGGGTWSESTTYQDAHHFGWNAFTFIDMFKKLELKDIREWSSDEYPGLEDIKDAARDCPITVNVEGKKPTGWKWDKVYRNLL
jgi:predicted SAM-dependent methyltransferase